jgi:hypothetical protein
VASARMPPCQATGKVRTLEFTGEGDVDAEVVLEFLDLAVDIDAPARSRGVRA